MRQCSEQSSEAVWAIEYALRLGNVAQLRVGAAEAQERESGVLAPRVGVVLEDGFQEADGVILQADECRLELGEDALRWSPLVTEGFTFSTQGGTDSAS